MDDQELKRLEERLRTRMGELEEEIRNDLQKAGRELASETHDNTERSFADQLASVDLAEADRDLGELRAVYAALQRMKNGTYGTCMACAAPIEEARLLAVPAAVRCLACEAQREAGGSEARV